MNKKLNLLYLVTILGIVVTSFILIKFYEIEANNLQYSIHDVITSLMPYKIIILAVAFFLMAMVFTAYKINRNLSAVKNVDIEKNRLIRINEELVCLSRVDTLTMLPNEKYFVEIYEKEFLRAIREKTFLSLISINIDDFKSYNDWYGEDEANETLIKISNLIKKSLKRPCDLFARLESDNFIILLPNTQNGNNVATRCLEDIQNLQILHENSIASNVLTITAGVSSINPTQIQEKEILLSNSKQALLKAKQLGRNRVIEIS